LPASPELSSGDLSAVHDALEKAGGGCALAFGIALIASGFASSTVGTYAGQVVMSGFLQRRIPVLARRAITMVPSLIVLAVAVEPTSALLVSQVVLSFCIPFALVPLVLISRDREVMQGVANRGLTNVLAVAITVVITGLNVGLIYGALS
jgi:manganese transport protein